MTYLGLDIGGSHCRLAFLPAGAGTSGTRHGVQPVVHGEAAALRAVAAVLLDVPRTTRIEQAVVAMAGAGDRQVAERLAAGLRDLGVAFPVLVTTDVLAAAAAALTAPGVAVWSGTGSFAVARGHDGRLHRSGGRGFLLGDEGSGYDLVRNAARAALIAADGRGPATALGAALTAAFDAPTVLRLGAILQGLTTADVSSHLPAVLDAASGGDAVARRLLDDGALALLALAEAAAVQAGLSWPNVQVTLGGGVLRNAASLCARIDRLLVARGAKGRLLADELVGAKGAAALAEARHRRIEPLCSWLDHDAP